MDSVTHNLDVANELITKMGDEIELLRKSVAHREELIKYWSELYGREMNKVSELRARLAELEPNPPNSNDFFGITGTRRPAFLED